MTPQETPAMTGPTKPNHDKRRPIAPRIEAKPGDLVADEYGDTRLVNRVDDYHDVLVIHDDNGNALIVPKGDEP